MTEDFNSGINAIEDKHSLISLLNKFSLFSDSIEKECGECHQKMTNKEIISHLRKNNHKSLKLIQNVNNSFKLGEIECITCSGNNIFNLSILISGEADLKDINKIIYCKKHLPKGYQSQTILDLLDFDDIINRKFNKVKLTYENKEEYFQIYKPLLIADMIYTKKAYDSKLEYEIELLVTKNEKYFFRIPEDFNEINTTPGRVICFTENIEEIGERLWEEDEEECKPFQFLGVISSITPYEDNVNEEKCFYNVWIIPMNKHVTSLKGHTGKYKIKEEYCTIPYQRMLEALDLFRNTEDDENNVFDRPIALYLENRILGHFPSRDEINRDKDGNIHEKWEDFLRKEENAMKLILFKENTLSNLVTSIDEFGDLNQSQIKALNNVFSNVLNLVQGPPGTGKTFLSTFIAYNIFKFRKSKEDKILLCSPSNSAADNLASNLINLNKILQKKMKILRIYSKSREFVEIDREIENVSLHKLLDKKIDEENIVLVSKEVISESIEKIVNDVDIVISTCSTSWDDRIKSYTFPFVIIDEVTQCCEIESLISITHGCKHLTLIGDQKQLGPVVLHPKANSTGMKVSLFERMIKLYPDLLNMLTIQYRMHAEIAKFASKEFYEDKIINGICLNDRKNEEFNDNFKWPNQNIPLIFVHTDKEEEVLKSGNSKQNEEEANLVVLFIEKIYNCGISFKDIGVITPYTAQKLLIQKKLKEKFKKTKINNLEISSVDGFQGREKNFIILSNVRSNKNNKIGFLKDFRRLNVSITRAKYGMIIIGNANCLYKNKSAWRNYINYFQENNLLYAPKTIIAQDGQKEFDINDLRKINILKDKNYKYEYENDEYDFDYSDNRLNINNDLLNNFDCCQNIYVEGNINYYKKKNEKKMKKRNKKRNKTITE